MSFIDISLKFGFHYATNVDIWWRLAVILETSVIRLRLKNLRCELSTSSDILPCSEEGEILFFQQTVPTKEEWEEKKELGTGFFNKREEKRAFNNLTRKETSR